MNESEIESDLRRFRPASPSSALAERLARELDASPATRAVAPRTRSPQGWASRWVDRLLWAGLGGAVACGVTLSAVSRGAATPSVNAQHGTPASPLQKLVTSEESFGWRDEGVHFDPSGRPLLKLRRVAVEHQAWADLENAGVVQVEVPRQEVIYVPMDLQ